MIICYNTQSLSHQALYDFNFLVQNTRNMTNLSPWRRNSFDARISHSSADHLAASTTELSFTSSLYVHCGSVDCGLSDYADSIANLVHELSTSHSFTGSRLSLPSQVSSRHASPRKNNHAASDFFDDSTSLILALENVAKQVSALPIPRPPSLSPLEWRHALDSPDDDLPPWEDIYDLVSSLSVFLCEMTRCACPQDENTMALKRQDAVSPPAHDYVEESGYASGSSSPYLFNQSHRDPAPRTTPHLRVITDMRLTPTIPSVIHSPRSPPDIPLPQTPADLEFMPISYDVSSSNLPNRTKSRTGGLKDMLLRQKRSAPPSPAFPPEDQTEKDSSGGTKKSDMRRLKSMLFGDAAEDASNEVLSFLDI